jgi:hypothetical protein
VNVDCCEIIENDKSLFRPIPLVHHNEPFRNPKKPVKWLELLFVDVHEMAVMMIADPLWMMTLLPWVKG